MSMVISKAQELADAISDSDELTSLRDAAEKLDADVVANAALRSLQEKQETVRRAASSGLQLPDDQMEELKRMQTSIRDIPTVQVFAEAQNNFNNLMNQVNDIIATAVMGEMPQEGGSCDSGCGCGGH